MFVRFYPLILTFPGNEPFLPSILCALWLSEVYGSCRFANLCTLWRAEDEADLRAVWLYVCRRGMGVWL